MSDLSMQRLAECLALQNDEVAMATIAELKKKAWLREFYRKDRKVRPDFYLEKHVEASPMAMAAE